MHFTSEQHLDGLVERDLVLDDVPGVLWTPASATTPVPLILLGHPGHLPRMRPRLLGRARRAAADGFACAAIELPGHGERPALPGADEVRAELRAAIQAGGRPSEDVVDRLVLPLVDATVPELRAFLDALLELPEIGGPFAYAGGVTATGVRLAMEEPRIVALGLFAGSYVPLSIVEEARQVTTPAHVLLQWDDHDNDRQRALDLYDALGSSEKTLQVNLGGHTGVPEWAGEDAARFYARHLSSPSLAA